MPDLTPPGRRRRLRRVAAQWPALLLLGVLWVALWGTITWGTFVAGVLLGAVVVAVLPLPPVGVRGTIRPWRAAVLAFRFATDLVVASFQVAWTALRPGPAPRGGVVAVPLRPAPDVFFAMTAELSSLVPGSLVVEADTERCVLYLHVLDLATAGGADGVRQQTLHLEERVLRAFASRPALARAGLLQREAAPATGATVPEEEQP
ncbi:Na+/H+ antiporter subunit E [Xylanimonas allomyrinae]|uniref:Na+/H+ antiporter subunit E n=1 Tax=Xylanimonas allomyrinae TaxID=2509459 RepID=A0A4P6EMZ8_9MICO|nr:Na+/H+ antiporter subunit E [Xylanimonas allomyrinae]QAY63835.1 Na+/H+ antiporter subunit E [Xylanimonas allomyrinae]